MKVLLAILAAYLVLLVVLAIVVRLRPDLREQAARIPELVRRLRRLATSRESPRSVRVAIWLLLAYLAMPIDIVPDVIPVIGWADDVVVVLLVVGFVRRRLRGRPAAELGEDRGDPGS